MSFSSSSDRPSLPTSYRRPEVWDPEHNSANAAFGGINSHIAEPRYEKELPRGEHGLQLYSCGTPNGIKVTLMLEELVERKLIQDYDAWFVSIGKGDQFSSGFTAGNPNQKIPMLLDYTDDKENPIRVFESGAILLYLAEKYAYALPKSHRERTECLNWLFWMQGEIAYNASFI